MLTEPVNFPVKCVDWILLIGLKSMSSKISHKKKPSIERAKVRERREAFLEETGHSPKVITAGCRVTFLLLMRCSIEIGG